MVGEYFLNLMNMYKFFKINMYDIKWTVRDYTIQYYFEH